MLALLVQMLIPVSLMLIIFGSRCLMHFLEHQRKLIRESGPSSSPGAGFETRADRVNEVCADFVRLLLGRMAQRVPTMITLQKITRDHGEEKFGEFRSSIIGMLDNTRYEQSILTTAKELLANTKFEQVSKLHRGQTRAIGKVEVWDPSQSDARESNSEMDATTRLFCNYAAASSGCSKEIHKV